MDKKDVIKITLKLIKEKKLEKTSIREIVKKLDLSLGNLYYHFKSKNDIYKETIEYSHKEVIENLNKVKIEKNTSEHEKRVLLKLSRFLGSIYEVLYVNKLVNKRNLHKEEIQNICESFWENIQLEN